MVLRHIQSSVRPPQAAARLDDGGTALLHGGNEVAAQPGLVANRLWDGLPGGGAVRNVRELRGRVIAPDNHILHLAHMHAQPLRHLQNRRDGTGYQTLAERASYLRHASEQACTP